MPEHVGDDEAREGSVADRIADEGEPAQDDEGAHHRADDADQDGRHEPALHEAVGHRAQEEVEHLSPPVVEVALARGGVVVVVGVVDDGPVAGRQDDDVAAVGGRQQRRVHHQIGRTERHDPAVDERRLVEVVGGAGEVVGRRHDGPARIRLGLQDPHQVLLGRDVDAGHRLVEEVQVGLRGERLGEEDPAPLPARERADLAVSLRASCGPSRGPRRRRPGRRGPAERPMPMSGTRPIITTSPTVTGNAQSTSLGLRHVGDPLGAVRRGGSPKTSTVPENGWSSPAIVLSSVLLPDPFGPMTASSEPVISRSMSARRVDVRTAATDGRLRVRRRGRQSRGQPGLDGHRRPSPAGSVS